MNGPGCPPHTEAPADGGCGLRATYYETRDLSGTPVATRLEASMTFDWSGGGPTSEGKTDDWSASFSGLLRPEATGDHTFFVAADDGYRLWLEGELLLDFWTGALSQGAAASVPLESGRRYRLQLDYFEGGGLAKLDLSWKRPSGERAAIAPCLLFEEPPRAHPCPTTLGRCTPEGTPPCGAGTGLRVTYFRPEDVRSKHVEESAILTLDFGWLPAAAQTTLPYHVLWEGYLEAPTDDAYTFYLLADGPSELMVGDFKASLAAEEPEVRAEASVTVPLFAGRKVPVRLEYRNLWAPQWGWLQVRWKSRTVPKGGIERCRLFPPAR